MSSKVGLLKVETAERENEGPILPWTVIRSSKLHLDNSEMTFR